MQNLRLNFATVALLCVPPNTLHFIHRSAMLMSKRLAYKSATHRWPASTELSKSQLPGKPCQNDFDSDNTTVAQQERQNFVIALRLCHCKSSLVIKLLRF